jgi:hypothetical protein
MQKSEDSFLLSVAYSREEVIVDELQAMAEWNGGRKPLNAVRELHINFLLKRTKTNEVSLSFGWCYSLSTR